MQLELWLHQPTQERYIVMVDGGDVLAAAGPLSPEQMGDAQRDEWTIPWQSRLAVWVNERREQFAVVWPPPPAGM